ncbi:MAG: hypothetical protein ACOZD0_12960 [Pseudomonadota bacterium]
MALFGDKGTTVPPLIGEIMQRFLASVRDAAIVLDLQPAVLADVAKCAAMAAMPRPPPVTLIITCGARRETVAAIRPRITAALRRISVSSRGVGGPRTIRLGG